MNLEDYINKYANFEDRFEGSLRGGGLMASFGAGFSIVNDALHKTLTIIPSTNKHIKVPAPSLSGVVRNAHRWALGNGLVGLAIGAYLGHKKMIKD
tara:strand:+ start:2488 stop:2775 length:288 start_codon:yes stop_codon:yes gene_type:complete